MTWTAKGYKEIKWRCINRLLYGKKECKCSPTIDEKSLHKAIVAAINEFCDVKEDVAKALRESVCEVLDPNLNGSVKAAKHRINELAMNIDELIKLATEPENSESAMSDIEKFSEEMKNLREFIESEKRKNAAAESNSGQLNAVLERIENEDFKLTEYDDVAVRQLVERVAVESKNCITVRFKGGLIVNQSL